MLLAAFHAKHGNDPRRRSGNETTHAGTSRAVVIVYHVKRLQRVSRETNRSGAPTTR